MPDPFVCRCLTNPIMLRFHTPLIEPDGRANASGSRRKVHEFAHGKLRVRVIRRTSPVTATAAKPAARLGGWPSTTAIPAFTTPSSSSLCAPPATTAAIGGRPHFTRPNFSCQPGYFPSGLVLRLNAFSFDTLEHFIFLERPTGNEQSDGKGFGTGEHKRDQAHRGLMPSSQDYKTVSHLYEAIRANLTAFVTRSGARSLFIGPESGQVDPELIQIHGIGMITGVFGTSGRKVRLRILAFSQGENSIIENRRGAEVPFPP